MMVNKNRAIILSPPIRRLIVYEENSYLFWCVCARSDFYWDGLFFGACIPTSLSINGFLGAASSMSGLLYLRGATNGNIFSLTTKDSWARALLKWLILVAANVAVLDCFTFIVIRKAGKL